MMRVCAILKSKTQKAKSAATGELQYFAEKNIQRVTLSICLFVFAQLADCARFKYFNYSINTTMEILILNSCCSKFFEKPAATK